MNTMPSAKLGKPMKAAPKKQSRRKGDSVTNWRLEQVEGRADKVEGAVQSIAESLSVLARIESEQRSTNHRLDAIGQRLDRHGEELDRNAVTVAGHGQMLAVGKWIAGIGGGTMIAGFVTGLWKLLSH